MKLRPQKRLAAAGAWGCRIEASPMRRHVLRFLLLVVGVAVVVTAAGGGYLRVVLGRSLPVTDGTLTLAGLG